MKKINKLKYHFMLGAAMLLSFVACKKSETGSDGQLKAGKGAPTITSVRTVSKSVVDSSRVDIYTTYNSDGSVGTDTVSNYNPQISAFDSTTVTGKLGNMYAIMGSNLGSVTQIQLNGISIPFNRALASDNTLLFSVSSSIPYVQPQPNTLVVTTLYGSVTYGFTVLPPAPTVTSVTNFNFTGGSVIGLKGVGFAAVTNTTLNGTTTAIDILSKTDTTMVVRMPSTSIPRAKISFTYTSGEATLHTGSSAEFINYDAAYKVFTENYDNGFVDGSWGDAGKVYQTVFWSGAASVGKTFASGSWSQFGFTGKDINKSDNYTYLTFYIKGGTKDFDLWISSTASNGGFASFNDAAKITVPKNVWTYFKIPMTQLDLFNTANSFNQFGFRIQGPDGADETFYLDDLMFVK